jgi:hypothetical protein
VEHLQRGWESIAATLAPAASATVNVEGMARYGPASGRWIERFQKVDERA